jgi:hypothetical protein
VLVFYCARAWRACRPAVGPRSQGPASLARRHSLVDRPPVRGRVSLLLIGVAKEFCSAATAIGFAINMLGFSQVLYAAFGGVLACYLLIYFGVYAMRKAGVTVDDEGNQREALLKEH